MGGENLRPKRGTPNKTMRPPHAAVPALFRFGPAFVQVLEKTKQFLIVPPHLVEQVDRRLLAEFLRCPGQVFQCQGPGLFWQRPDQPQRGLRLAKHLQMAPRQLELKVTRPFFRQARLANSNMAAAMLTCSSGSNPNRRATWRARCRATTMSRLRRSGNAKRDRLMSGRHP